MNNNDVDQPAGAGVGLAQGPERIWIPVDPDCDVCASDQWASEPLHNGDIEYVRADLARTPSPNVQERARQAVTMFNEWLVTDFRESLSR